MTSPVLYILTGLPYSGKTTLRKELVKRLRLKYVSVDEIMVERGMWEKGQPTQDDWNIAYSQAYKEIKNYLEKKESVVFDCANLMFKERETPRQIADESSASHKLIYINTPHDEIKRRRHVNEQTKERGHVEDEIMSGAFKGFELPTPEETPIIYNSQMNLDDWIEKNISVV